MGGYAWVTLATNNSYSLGALVLAHSLKKANTAHKLVVLITPAVSQSMRDQLQSVFDLVKVVDVLDSKDEAHLALMKRPELGITFTKIHCWRLVEFEKCVFLDADTLVVRNCDELFEKEEFSAAPDASWPDCFNSGVFVYRPSVETFNKILQFAVENRSFDGGDQGLLNQFFREWATEDIKKHLPFVYNLTSIAAYSYIPAFKHYGSETRIVHFIGQGKPWLQQLDSSTRTVTPSPGSEHLAPLLQQWWDLFCEKVHPNLDKNLESSNNGMSHPSVEVNILPVALTDEPQMALLTEPCTPYRETDDLRQRNLPYIPFNVEGPSGELLNVEFLLTSVVPPDEPPEQSLNEQHRQEEEQKDQNVKEENKSENEFEERSGETKKEQEQNSTKAEEDNQNRQEDPPPPKDPFDYNSFFPDETCISNYLEKNVETYQPFEDHHHQQDNSENPEEKPPSLPRFLTIPQNDQRQSGNVETHEDPPRDNSDEHPPPSEEAFTPPKKEIPPREEYNHSIAVEEKRELSKSKSTSSVPWEVETVKTPPRPSIWKSQPDLNVSRRYSMPKLKPLLPRERSFSKSIPSEMPKVTLYTEFVISSEYKDPVDLPNNKIDFVETHIRRERKLRRSKSDADIKERFGPLPYIPSPKVDKPVLQGGRPPWRNFEECYDLSQCKRQMGNKPKPKGAERRKENVLPALKPILPSKDKKQILIKKRKSKELSPGDGGKEKIPKWESKKPKDRKRESTVTPRNVSTTGNSLDEILEKLKEYSKKYQHFFGVTVKPQGKAVVLKNARIQTSEEGNGECEVSDPFEKFSTPVSSRSRETQTPKKVPPPVEGSEFRQFRNYVKDQQKTSEKGLLNIQDFLSCSEVFIKSSTPETLRTDNQSKDATTPVHSTQKYLQSSPADVSLPLKSSVQNQQEFSNSVEDIPIQPEYKSPLDENSFGPIENNSISHFKEATDIPGNDSENLKMPPAHYENHVGNSNSVLESPVSRKSSEDEEEGGVIDCSLSMVASNSTEIEGGTVKSLNSSESKVKEQINDDNRREESVEDFAKLISNCSTSKRQQELREEKEENVENSKEMEKKDVAERNDVSEDNKSNGEGNPKVLENGHVTEGKDLANEEKGDDSEKKIIESGEKEKVEKPLKPEEILCVPDFETPRSSRVSPPNPTISETTTATSEEKPENFTQKAQSSPVKTPTNGYANPQMNGGVLRPNDSPEGSPGRKKSPSPPPPPGNPERKRVEDLKATSGIAGAIAQLSLEAGGQQTPGAGSASSAQEEYLRRQNWETGNMDYMGKDSFDNIWSKICQTIEAKDLDEKGAGRTQPPLGTSVTEEKRDKPAESPAAPSAVTEKCPEFIETLPTETAAGPPEDDEIIFSKPENRQSSLTNIAEEEEAKTEDSGAVGAKTVKLSDILQSVAPGEKPLGAKEAEKKVVEVKPEVLLGGVDKSAPSGILGMIESQVIPQPGPEKPEAVGMTPQPVCGTHERKSQDEPECKTAAQTPQVPAGEQKPQLTSSVQETKSQPGPPIPESKVIPTAPQTPLSGPETKSQPTAPQEAKPELEKPGCTTAIPPSPTSLSQPEPEKPKTPQPPSSGPETKPQVTSLPQEAKSEPEKPTAPQTSPQSAGNQVEPTLPVIEAKSQPGPVIPESKVVPGTPQTPSASQPGPVIPESKVVPGTPQTPSAAPETQPKTTEIEETKSQPEPQKPGFKGVIATPQPPTSLQETKMQSQPEKPECKPMSEVPQTPSSASETKTPPSSIPQETKPSSVAPSTPSDKMPEPKPQPPAECKTVAVVPQPTIPSSEAQQQPKPQQETQKTGEKCKTVAIPSPPIVFPGTPFGEKEKKETKGKAGEERPQVVSEPIPLPPPETPPPAKEPETKKSRSTSPKEEGKTKKGVFSKLLEMVGVAPKEKNESELTKSVFYDVSETPQSDQKSEVQKLEVKEAEKPSEKPSSDVSQGVGGVEKLQGETPVKVEEKKGMAPEPEASKSEEISVKPVTEVEKKDEKEKQSQASLPGFVERKSGEEETRQPPIPKPARKSPSPKLTIPHKPPETAVTMPTPPPQPDVPPRKNSGLLKVDDTILETPPVGDLPKESTQGSDKGKTTTEIEEIIGKAKSEVESLLQDTGENSDLINTMKLMMEGKQPEKSTMEEVEELKVTSEEERMQHRGEAVSSKLSDQILKAIPPPRRKAISEASASASTSAIPKPTASPPEQKTPPGDSKPKPSKPSSIPVPPPRNKGKPSPPSPPKTKGKK